MEQKCIQSADIDSTGCHLKITSSTATTTTAVAAAAANTPEEIAFNASYLRSPQMSSKEQQQPLQLQTHNNNFSDKKLFESYVSLTQNNDDGRGCSMAISTPASENIILFKNDDDSRSGSSDDVTTPIVDLQNLHQRHNHHRHGQHQNGNSIENKTTPSPNTIEVIQDPSQESSDNNGSVGVGIYLETPVIDEQIVSLNSHDYEKAKPKRLSDEFLRSSEDCCDDDRNSSSDSNPLTNHSNSSNKTADCNLSNSNISGILKKEGILNDLIRSVWSNDDNDVNGDNGENLVGYCESHQYNNVSEDVDVPATSGGSMSFRFKNITIDYEKVNGDELNDVDGVGSDGSENDVQSMDAIERRDFEHEQRLTGGIILKSSSLAKNDRLKLELIQQNTQNANNNNNNNQQRAISSDSKCTYKDHSTTPTSSRHCKSRLTKSTAKVNLSTSLSSHPEALTNGDTNSQNPIDIVDGNSSSSNSRHHKVQQKHQSSESMNAAIEPSLLEAEPTSPLNLRKSLSDKKLVEVLSDSNSNEIASEHSYSTSSSHSLSDTNKQKTQPECLNSEEELLKQAVESIHKLQQQQHLLQKSDKTSEDEIASTSSSARCQYSSALKYIRNPLRKDSTSALNNDDPATLATSDTAKETLQADLTSTVSSTIAINGNSQSNFQNSSQQQLNHDVASGPDIPIMENELHENDFDDETWADCEEGSDEEVCTCHKETYAGKRDTSDMISDDALSKDVELSSYIQMVSISEDTLSHEHTISPEFSGLQRKRKFNESRLVDADHFLSDTVSGRKRIAYDYASTPRSSQTLILIASPSTPLGRRTPRSLIPTRDNPPPELQDWLVQFQRWSHAERLLALDRLIEHCDPTQVRHMMKVIEPQFQRDFISLLPRELALQVLAYLDPKDLLRAAQTCRSWRFLCDDNLLWKEKCRKAQILTEPKTDRPKRGRAGNMPPIASPWKAAYMRQHIIEMNWRSRPIREPKVLKGHDDHVITCLQFSGNRIVSGSDDNTLKVWSAVTGRCLRTLVGHTGGVWSSQMSGNIIISGSTDRTLKVWDMETGNCVHTLMGHTSTVRCMHLHGKKVVSGSRDATLRVWDIERGACLHVLVGHLAAVRCVQYDGKLIVSGAYDYMVKIWHPERQECLHTLQGHTNRVYSLQFDGIHVVSGSLDTSIRVWDVETGNCKHTLMGHQSLTSGMELRQNILVSGNADSTVKVWDITSGQCLQTLSGPNKHQSAVTCLQFNSRFVITSSDDGTVKLWDVKTGEFIRNLVALDSGGSGGVVWRIRANDTKLICAVGSRNGTEETKLMVLDFDVEGACVKCS